VLNGQIGFRLNDPTCPLHLKFTIHAHITVNVFHAQFPCSVYEQCDS